MASPENSNPSFSHGRRWLNWLNMTVAVAAVLAMVVMVNYLAAGHFKRYQVDRDSAFRLSEQTIHVLEGLSNNVDITIFFQPHGENEEIYDLTAGLLNEYAQANPRHIHLKTIDYNRDVGEAKKFLIKHPVQGLKESDFVYFECGNRTKLISAKDLADYDFTDLMAGRSKFVRRSAFLGELYFTGDIYDVSNPRPKKTYFLTGHGENDPEDNKNRAGYSRLASVVSNEVNCDWAKLNLQGTNLVPEDCQLLIVPASDREGRMTTLELAKIGAYLKQGGRMLALLTAPSGLETILGEWGIALGDSRNGRVVETDTNYVLPGGYGFLTAQINPHPIMNALAVEKMPVEMVFPRPIIELENQTKAPGAPQITILAATTLQGLDERTNVGEYSLLAAVEQGSIKGVSSLGGRGTRIVVAGDSDFLDDQLIDSVGNHTFALGALNWLLQSPQIMLEGLGPRPIKQYKLTMSQAQAQSLRFLFLGGLPGGIILLGGLVWLRRRS